MWLSEHRTSPRSLADLLNWAALVAPGVLLQKDGSFLAGWRYRGPDLDSATDEELAALSEQVNRTFLAFGEDAAIYVNAARRPSPDYPGGGDFPDPITAAIDEERRRQYEASAQPGVATAYETEYTLLLGQLPPPDARARLLRLFVTADEDQHPYSRYLESFRTQLDTVEDQLGTRLDIERLNDGALLTHLHECLTALPHSVAVPETPCYLDALLASQDFIAGFEPRIGAKHLAVIALSGLPMESRPGLLDHLNRLAIPYRWATRWLPLETHTAQQVIGRFQRNWWQKRRGLGGLIRDVFTNRAEQAVVAAAAPERGLNRDAVRMADDAENAAGEAASGLVRYGYYTNVVVLAHEDKALLRSWTRDILKTLAHHGFPGRLEDINAVDAWRGSLPGHGYPNVRRPLISSRNLADLLPLTSIWPGLRHNPSPLFPPQSPPLLTAATSGATPHRLSLHVSDVGHTLIVGPTGAGKSTLLGLLMAQWCRYPEARVVCFDKGGSAYPLTMAVGGHHYQVAAPDDRALVFQPLAALSDPGELAWAVEWVETLVTLQGVPVTPAQRTKIETALRLLADRSQPIQARTLTNLHTKIQDVDLRAALRPYTLYGAHGELLDADHDGLLEGHWQTFEMAHLMEHGQKLVVPVLLYLFHRIQRRLDGKPTLICLDEAWTYLLDPLFADRIRIWLKELRKFNALVIFSTQSLSDIHASPNRHVLLESCPTKLFLANPEAATEHGAEVYRSIGLNARQIELIAAATPKRDYYYASPLGRRLLDLNLGPLTLAFVGAGSRDDLRTVHELVSAYGDAWVPHWLRQRGLAAWAAELDASSTSSPRRVLCG